MKFTATLIILIIALFFMPFSTLSEKRPVDTWEKQLNEMNYLIMRTSATNIIYGLLLTYKQVESLKKLCRVINSFNPPIQDMKGNASNDMVKVRNTFQKLTGYLIKKKSIPESLKNRIIIIRLLESEIIKKSILGAQKSGYRGTGCLRCHASPRHFPKGDISGMKTRRIKKEKREEIDMAHVVGLFGDRGTGKLWGLKSKVDKILNSGQKFLFKDFQCCLLPPENLANPTRIGQAFVTDVWINYFQEIRAYSKKDWESYKQLYIIPLEDLIEATLPGIRKREKKKILKKLVKIIEDSRRMDDIDFELKKESLCLRLRDELNLPLIRETKDEKEYRQFQAAIFLLLPGNTEIYNEVIKRIESEKK